MWFWKVRLDLLYVNEVGGKTRSGYLILTLQVDSFFSVCVDIISRYISNEYTAQLVVSDNTNATYL